MSATSPPHATTAPSPSSGWTCSGIADILFSETRLPTVHGVFRCAVFRQPTAQGVVEHVAMVAGDITGDHVLCRVHSACLTSEVFGSTKCDCSAQLACALEKVQARGRGVVLYLQQEGRGIGLGNKIAAYRQQEAGFDTVDANRVLGFADDAREYGFASKMLKRLGVEGVELLTNNPAKVAGLRSAGVRVRSTQAHAVAAGPIARAYLETKRVRMQHILPGPARAASNRHAVSDERALSD